MGTARGCNESTKRLMIDEGTKGNPGEAAEGFLDRELMSSKAKKGKRLSGEKQGHTAGSICRGLAQR